MTSIPISCPAMVPVLIQQRFTKAVPLENSEIVVKPLLLLSHSTDAPLSTRDPWYPAFSRFYKRARLTWPAVMSSTKRYTPAVPVPRKRRDRVFPAAAAAEKARTNAPALRSGSLCGFHEVRAEESGPAAVFHWIRSTTLPANRGRRNNFRRFVLAVQWFFKAFYT